jgi:23S rRNA pseudouridine2605 synthase
MANSPQSGVRLNKFLASCGLGSRRACEQLILDGYVEVNGDLIVELATRVTERDHVKVNGKLVRSESPIAVVINKPKGFICTTRDPEGRRTIYELLPNKFRGLAYVGRLDFQSCGLLILSNSGEFNQRLTHPKHEVEKEYAITLDRGFDRDLTEKLLTGIKLSEGMAKAERISFESRKRLKIVLKQGLNRQIRRMFSALDYKVKQLERVRIGSFTAPDLSTGEYRVLNSKDLAAIEQNPVKPGGAKIG